MAVKTEGVSLEDALSPPAAGEVLTHLAFYAGWPNAFSTVPVVQDIFESRPD